MVTGVTRITRPQAWVLIVAFLGSLAVVPLVDLPGKVGGELAAAGARLAESLRHEWESPGSMLEVNRVVERELRSIESVVADHSLLAKFGRPILLEWMLAVGAGNENAYPGREGWLFFRPDIDFLTARSFAKKPGRPENAIASFAADLAGRGILLVLLPVPGKAAIHPEMFAAGLWETMPESADAADFKKRLDAAVEKEFARRGLKGPLPVLADPGDLLWQKKKEGPQFLKTDTHWTPDAMESVAAWVANQLGHSGIAPSAPTDWVVSPETISGRGDTASMLNLPSGSRWITGQTVEVQRVHRSSGEPWSTDASSPVLLLGDSFTNMYSQAELGWGSGAGLAEHLSLGLGQTIDRITRNDDGAWATREMLASELRRDPRRLEGKKVVVWQFAMRELVSGDWKDIPLPGEEAHTAEAENFVVLKPGESRRFEGRILAMGALPVIGTTPDRDYLTAFHLQETGGGDQAVVYLQTLKDNERTAAARLAPGQTISLNISSWMDAEETFGSMNRGDLEDGSLLLQEPNFGILEP